MQVCVCGHFFLMLRKGMALEMARGEMCADEIWPSLVDRGLFPTPSMRLCIE